MKLFKILLSLFIFLSLNPLVFSQQYSNEKYERYVGWQFGKYPPTQQGIQDAVNSLKDVVDDEHTGIIHLAQGVI